MISPKVVPTLVTGLLLAGLAMIGLGQAWSYLLPSSAYWGAEQAKELTEAQTNLHAATHHHGTEEERQRDFQAARDRFVAIQQQLESARGLRDHTGTYLTGFGIVLILAGVAIHFIANKSD